MASSEELLKEIRAMAIDCSVCERDAIDAAKNLGVALDLDGIAHEEDAFAFDLMSHRREFHRDKLLHKVQQLASLGRQCG